MWSATQNDWLSEPSLSEGFPLVNVLLCSLVWSVANLRIIPLCGVVTGFWEIDQKMSFMSHTTPLGVSSSMEGLIVLP